MLHLTDGIEVIWPFKATEIDASIKQSIKGKQPKVPSRFYGGDVFILDIGYCC